MYSELLCIQESIVEIGALFALKKNHWSIIRDASTKRVWIISNQLAVEMRHSPVQCKCIGDNCLPKRRSLLVLSNSVTVRTLWHATPLWTESGQARRPWQRTKLAGFWPDVWPHGILTNIS